MKNSISNFANFALSRSEMKAVSGGCGVKINGTWDYGFTKAEATSMVMNGVADRWCCASC